MIKVVLCYFFILVDRFVAVQLKERHHTYSKYQWRKSHHSEYQWKREKDMKSTKYHSEKDTQHRKYQWMIPASHRQISLLSRIFSPHNLVRLFCPRYSSFVHIVFDPLVHPLYGGLTSRTHTHTRPVYNHTVILVRSVPWWLCCATTPEYMCWESLVGSWCLCWCVWTTRWPVHTESMGTPVHRVHDTR